MVASPLTGVGDYLRCPRQCFFSGMGMTGFIAAGTDSKAQPKRQRELSSKEAAQPAAPDLFLRPELHCSRLKYVDRGRGSAEIERAYYPEIAAPACALTGLVFALGFGAEVTQALQVG